jgi:hypothetical protein
MLKGSTRVGGGHFLLQTARDAVLDIVERELVARRERQLQR